MLSLCTFALYVNKLYFEDFSQRFQKETTKAARTEMLMKLWQVAYDMGGAQPLIRPQLTQSL